MNDAWVVYLALLSVVVIACGALALAWTRGRLGVASAVVLVLAAVTWVLDFAALTTGFHDADGFVDCGHACRPPGRARVRRAAAVARGGCRRDGHRPHRPRAAQGPFPMSQNRR
jgi:hypothetical protein